MVNPLEKLFPGLALGGYQVTSLPNRDYNCIGWAVGDNHHWWWPSADVAKEYWPDGLPRERTCEAFVAAFATLGYEVCEGDALEPHLEKIALFADADGRPNHAARQLPSGMWTSKLGKAEDIEHRLRDLEGAIYGTVILILKRTVLPVTDARAKGNSQ